jgi:hypothetical protein
LTNKKKNIEKLKKNGFVHLKKFIPKKKILVAQNKSLNLYLKEHKKTIVQGFLPKQFSLKNPFPKIDTKKMYKFMKGKDILSMPTLYGSMSVRSRLSKEFLNILMDKKIIQQFSELLSSQKVYLHLCPALRIIHPNFNFSLVPPHNDLSYNLHFKNRFKPKSKFIKNFLSVWIPIKGNPKVDGGLKIYKSLYSTNSNSIKQSMWLKSIVSKDSKYFKPKFEIGDMIIFEPFLIHGSAKVSKYSKDFRISMDCRIFGENTITPRHYMDLSTGEKFNPSEGPCGYKN